MKRASFVLLFLCLAGAASRAETAAEQRGKQVIDSVLAALGGDHFLAMRNRMESGRAYSFYREQLSGLSLATIYTRYLIRPEPPVAGFLGVRERQVFGKNGESAILFTDGNGYEISYRGARPLSEEQLSRFKDSTLHNIFYILRQRLGEPGLIFVSRGTDIFDNQPCEIVDIIDADNRTTTVYFNHDTRFPIRQVYYRRDPQTRYRDEEETVFSKFRDVGGGVMWPFTIRRQRNGEKIYEIFSDAVQINSDELKDDLFTLPANMKILSKKK
ncbi:MAG TPA: hypothetical protein VG672_03680 [Bryobacteraceae bacterium]|jgi:hypothetical protein|nr:hypothetical protein [Bryobacteraceae bacterium]